MELAARLRAEAVATDERRLLVLAGEASRTRERARAVLAGADIDPGDTTYVGPADTLPCEQVGHDRVGNLLGTTRDAIVLDCHSRCEPNAIGSLVGAVDGGGLFVLLTPPLETWPDRRDEFDETLAIPPFEREDVTNTFRARLVETLRDHRGIAIVDVDGETTEKEGLVDPPPRLPEPEPAVPANTQFPVPSFERCLTQDQVDALAAFEQLTETGQALVVSANRGRGKSSAAGLAAACLAAGGHDVLVTAPQYRSAGELFARASELLESMDAIETQDSEDRPQLLETASGAIRFVEPARATDLPGDPDRVIVDEAAALPVNVLTNLLEAPSIAFTTTIHGYEGAGRSFSVRFRDILAESSLSVTERELVSPIRYSQGDPIEVWSFRALALDARPAVDSLLTDVTLDSATYCEFSTTDLLADEHLLGEVFGLLVLAHYRTEPNDLARLLDAPNVSVHGLVSDGHVVSVALLAREGNLPADLRRSMYDGQRVRGNLIPDVLTSQLRDERAGETVGLRVMRIATHGAVRSRGLGSKLLSEIATRTSNCDWLGVGYGATPELLSFWDDNEFSTVHLSTTRNKRSGEHSAIMLRPLSPAGEALLGRHSRWFIRRFPSMLTDTLSDVDPDVIRGVCRATDGIPSLELTEWEWRHVSSVAEGPSIFEMAPRPVRRLAFRWLVESPEPVESGDDELSPREERLLVRRALQAAPRDQIAVELGFPSTRQCMRAFGVAVETLYHRYDNDKVAADQTDGR